MLIVYIVLATDFEPQEQMHTLVMQAYITSTYSTRYLLFPIPGSEQAAHIFSEYVTKEQRDALSHNDPLTLYSSMYRGTGSFIAVGYKQK